MKANMSAKWCKINKPPCATSFPPSLSIKKKKGTSELKTSNWIALQKNQPFWKR